jgi:hypothetical protein
MICIASYRGCSGTRAGLHTIPQCPTGDAKIIHPCRWRRGRRQGNSAGHSHSHRWPYILSASVTALAIGTSLVAETRSGSKVCRRARRALIWRVPLGKKSAIRPRRHP